MTRNHRQIARADQRLLLLFQFYVNSSRKVMGIPDYNKMFSLWFGQKLKLIINKIWRIKDVLNVKFMKVVKVRIKKYDLTKHKNRLFIKKNPL